MSQPDFSVHIINPRKKTGKKTAKKKTTRRHKRPAAAAAKKTTKKKVTKRSTNMAKRRVAKKVTSRRRRAPASRGTTPARRITRRRRRTANPRRRRRRVASYAKAGFGGVMNEMRDSMPRMLGKLAAAWAVRRWSMTPGGMFGVAYTSPTAGEGWSLPQYVIAGIVAMWGPGLVSRFVDAKQFRAGVVDLMMEKFIWTEGIARNSWAVTQFGTGDVGYNNGQAFVNQGGRWGAMQGLVGASPLDGLVESSPLDGDLDYGYGHLLPANVSTDLARSGKYHGSGYTSNYHAAFSK